MDVILETGAEYPERPLDALRKGTTKSVNAALIEQLRADLLSCAIPPDVKLKISEVCERYAVSPGAAREALSRLVPEGLVDFNDQRGFRSSPLTIEGIKDVSRARLIIEKEALVDSMRHGDEGWESQILAAQHRLSKCEPRSKEWPGRHREFHQALVSACTSPWLIRLHNLLYDQSERYRHTAAALASAVTGATRDVANEHSRIANAVIARNESHALALLEAHLQLTRERVIAVLQEASRRRS